MCVKGLCAADYIKFGCQKKYVGGMTNMEFGQVYSTALVHKGSDYKYIRVFASTHIGRLLHHPNLPAKIVLLFLSHG